MTVLVGTMQLPVPQDADRVRDYLNGTIADGGLWTGLTRASDHDHTGGLNGKPISVASIPDGSITSSKLDPSVLLPYALVDGSKPFTGQVALNGDAIVRNTLYFGAKPAGAADVTVARTGAGALRLDNHLGVGVAPAAWGATWRALQVSASAALWGDAGASADAHLSSNTYYDGTNRRAIQAAGGWELVMHPTVGFQVHSLSSVAAGAVQTVTTRAAISPTGSLTLSPDAGSSALLVTDFGKTAFAVQRGGAGSESYRVAAPSALGFLELYGGGGGVIPMTDNTQAMGQPTVRWTVMYAVTGSINTSHVSMKRDFAPLDPAACVAAVEETDWLSFTYNPPAPPERAEGVDDEAWTAQQESYQKMLTETAPARRSKGYVLGSDEYQTADLFGTVDRKSGQATADLAVVACALQDALRRLAALEGARA